MKVFVDTNVWLAGRFGRGLCADLLNILACDERLVIMLDPRIHAEFRRIARDKFAVDAQALVEADIFFIAMPGSWQKQSSRALAFLTPMMPGLSRQLWPQVQIGLSPATKRCWRWVWSKIYPS